MVISAERIKSIVSGCKTQPDIISALRMHKVKYMFTTETGFLSIRIPYKKGIIRIYKTCSVSCPFVVRSESSTHEIRPVFPVVHNWY